MLTWSGNRVLECLRTGLSVGRDMRHEARLSIQLWECKAEPRLECTLNTLPVSSVISPKFCPVTLIGPRVNVS